MAAKKELTFAEQADKDRRAEYASVLANANPFQQEDAGAGGDDREAKVAEAEEDAK